MRTDNPTPPPTPSPPPNYGGFAGHPMPPDLKPFTWLEVSWWDGSAFHTDNLLVVPEGEVGDRFEIPWERVQTWQVLPS